jgi:hypothetical protein
MKISVQRSFVQQLVIPHACFDHPDEALTGAFGIYRLIRGRDLTKVGCHEMQCRPQRC